ncbi:unnamed protein product [Ranitomeya imitator]|uniref:Uncharacterized protein n=1 Tax=Ranitomeya imitator TaxID=111125 RepID=A0ABN9LF32_9NEOB|nr:unnamed protein product [Ranitomeya imitator]
MLGKVQRPLMVLHTAGVYGRTADMRAKSAHFEEQGEFKRNLAQYYTLGRIEKKSGPVLHTRFSVAQNLRQGELKRNLPQYYTLGRLSLIFNGRETSEQEADMNSEVILEETLIKRSQQKKRTSPLNYKERIFVLTKSKVTYYEGRSEKRNKKGSVDITKIKCVEVVKNTTDQIPCQNKYAFQIIYDTNTLYVFAPTAYSRSQWVKSLKKEIKYNNNTLSKYHPQFWADGVFQCCRQTDKLAPGCEEYNLFNDFPRKPPPPTPDELGPPLPPPPEDNLVDNHEHKEELVVALFDFHPVEPHDLHLVAMEEYMILERKDVHWWRARNKHGHEGYIPSNYVTEKKQDNLDQYPWYSKSINRSKAEQLLKMEVSNKKLL